jgi:hypothetical protein
VRWDSLSSPKHRRDALMRFVSSNFHFRPLNEMFYTAYVSALADGIVSKLKLHKHHLFAPRIARVRISWTTTGNIDSRKS